MASPIGGQFVFSATGQTVILGIHNGSGIAPLPVAGDYNIEVFTSPTVTAVPPNLDTIGGVAFNAGVVDHGATVVNNFLTGSQVTLGGGAYMVTDSVTGAPGQTAAEINTGSGAQTVNGANGDTLTGGSGPSQILNGLAGSETVNGGSGAGDSIWGGANSSISGGTGTGTQIVIGTTVAGSGTGTTVVAGATGSETIRLAASDTLTASAGNATVGVSAAAGNDSVDLSSNTAASGTYVTGGVGDTITAGSGTSAIDAQAGSMSVQLTGGAAGVTGANAGDTITGGSGFTGSLNFNPGTVAGGSGDLINLSGSTGNATINAYSYFSGSPLAETQLTAVNDTIDAGNGAVSVWGGPGDRIGADSAGGAGTGTFWHSTSVTGAAIQFGTFDSVQAVTYGSGPGQVTINNTLPGASSATDTVTHFNTTNDSVFYANRTGNNQDSSIVATATVSGGNTTITLPDGTTMTLLGVASASSIHFIS